MKSVMDEQLSREIEFMNRVLHDSGREARVLEACCPSEADEAALLRHSITSPRLARLKALGYRLYPSGRWNTIAKPPIGRSEENDESVADAV